MANKTIPTILTNEGNVGIGISRSASLNTTAAANGTGGGNRGFDTSFSSTTTGFTGTDATDYGYGYFAATIVAGRSYEVSATMVVTNGAPLSLITSSGLNFATQTVESIASPPVSNTIYRFVATASATFVGLGFSRTSGTMTAVVSNFSIKEVGSTLVTSESNVGIGTTSPLKLLHVHGPTGEVVRLSMASSYTAGHGPQLSFWNATTEDLASIRGVFNETSQGNRANLIFGTRTSDTLGIETKMTILHNGNVGIGITNPSSKLHIDDASAPWITISRAGVPTWQLRNNFPNNQYGFSFNNTTAGTVPLFIGAGGNIGIGLDSPAAKLDIVGTASTIALSFGTTVPNNPLFINTYAGSMGIGMDQTTAGIRLAGDYSAGSQPLVDIGYYSGGTVSHANWVNRLRVQQNGNVGIGITNPASKLHVSGVGATIMRLDAETLTSVAQFQVKANTDGVLIAGMYGPNPVAGTVFGANTSGAAFLGTTTLATVHPTLLAIGTSNTIPIIFGTNNTERMRIAGAGNVGIGITTPLFKLDNYNDTFRSLSRVSEKIIAVTFPNAVANQKVDIVFDVAPGAVVFWGNLEIEITDEFVNQLATGKLIKVFALGLNPATGAGPYGSAIYDNSSYYTAAYGAVADNYAIDGVFFNATTGKYYFTIIHITSTGNTPVIKIKGFTKAIANSDNINNLTAGAVYTTNTTVYYRPVVETLQSRIGFNGNINQTAALLVRGNIGVGTTNPSSRLVFGSNFASVSGITVSTDNFEESQFVARKAASKCAFGIMAWEAEVYLSAGVYYNNSTWQHHNANNNNQLFVLTPGGGAKWYASNNGTSSWNIASNIQLWGDNGAWTNLLRSTAGADSYILGGKFGIGTASPSTLLSVGGVGSVTAASGITLGGDTSANIYRSAASQIKTDGSFLIANDLIVNGRVGIGTTAPSGRLNIVSLGSVGFVPSTTGPIGASVNSRVHLQGAEPGLMLSSDIHPVTGIQTNTQAYQLGLQIGYYAVNDVRNQIYFGNGPLTFTYSANQGVAVTERMRIDTAGRVGIGTTSALAQLHVTGQTYLTNAVTSVARNQLTINTNGANYAHFYDAGVAANNALSIGGNGAIATVPTKAIMTWRLSTENVGIGLTNPEAASALHIKNTDAAAKVTIESADASESFINFSAQSSEYSVGFVRDGSNVNSLRFCAADGLSAGEVMRLQNTNVGIGTTVPTYRLDIEGASATSVVQNVRNPSTSWNQYALTRYQTDTKNSRYVDVGYFRGVSNEDTRGFVISGLSSNILTLLEPSAYLGLGGVPVPLYNIDVASTQGKGIQLRYDTSTGYRAQITPYWNTSTDTRIDFAINRSANLVADVIMSVGYGSKVGIGTTAPTGTLTIQSNSNQLRLQTATGPGAYFTNISSFYDSTHPFAIEVANNSSSTTEYFGIYSDAGGANSRPVFPNGNVGIGTTRPSGKLTVQGDIEVNYNSTTANTSVRRSFITAHATINRGANIAFGLFDGGSNPMGMTVYNVAAAAGAYNSQFIAFHTHEGGVNEGERMRITQLGNVGIGTFTPHSLLDVQLASAATRYLTLSTNDGQGSANGFGLNFRIADQAHNIAQIRGSYETSVGGGDGGLFFATRSAGVLSDRLSINANGRVGIGVSFGTTLLSVGGAGSTLPASGITFGANSVANLYRSEADHIKTDGSFVVTNTLIVGGGQNGIRIFKNGSDSISSTLYIANAANTRAYNFQPNAAGTNLALWTYNSANAWQNSVNFNYNGSVGIGTITPSGKLHIVSTIAGETVLRTDGTNGTLFSVVDDLSDSLMSVNNSAGLPVLEVFADDRVVAGQYGSGDFVLINNKVGLGTSNPTNKLSVIGGASIGSSTYNVAAPSNGLIVEGNVGIGTANPSYKLDVSASVTNVGRFYNNQTTLILNVGSTNNTEYTDLQLITNNGNAQFFKNRSSTSWGGADSLNIYTSNGAITFHPAGTQNAVYIDSNGNVGIGSAGPSSKLDVYGGTLTVATKSSYALAVGNANTDLTFGANASNAYIQSWSSKPLYINNQGNNTIIGADVGIGNVTPVGARLHIKGDTSNPVLRVEDAQLVGAAGGTAGKTFVGWLPIMTGALSPADKVFIPLYK